MLKTKSTLFYARCLGHRAANSGGLACQCVGARAFFDPGQPKNQPEAAKNIFWVAKYSKAGLAEFHRRRFNLLAFSCHFFGMVIGWPLFIHVFDGFCHNFQF